MDTPAQHFTHAFDGQTTIQPLALLLVLAAGLALLLIPRRSALWPVLTVVCCVPSEQRIVIAGADFTLLRLMVLFGTVRILMRSEWRGIRWRALDTAVLLWATAMTALPTIRIGTSVLVYLTGQFYDAVGMYFMFRILVRTWSELRSVAKALMVVSMIAAICFAVELGTRRNMFSIFGGVPEVTAERDGRLRCQGAFNHPLMAGCFFVSMIPLMAAQWWQPGRSRFLIVMGVAAATFIVISTASATPLMGLICAAIGGLFFILRKRMRLVRWAILMTLVLLHLVMEKPVWHLIARISVVGGNSSWHRYELVNGAIHYWYEWWAIGSDKGSAHWGHHTFDVTNMYIVQGLNGGALQLILFVATIVLGFRAAGGICAAVANNRQRLILAWALGVGLFVQAANHFGVSYFGQIWMIWYLALAMIGSISSEAVCVPATTKVRSRPAVSAGVGIGQVIVGAT